jgi:hypothetical protein
MKTRSLKAKKMKVENPERKMMSSKGRKTTT